MTEDRYSKHFTVAEMTKSNTAIRLGLNNIPTPGADSALRALCAEILEPIRNALGVVRVSSGYRCPALNAAVKGDSSSAHVRGEAADIEVDGLSNLDLAAWIKNSGLIFDQCILEMYSPGEPHSGWVHVSHSRSFNRGEVLTARRLSTGEVVYTPGLPAN